MKRSMIVGLAAAVILAGSISVVTAGPLEDTVKARQSYYQVVSSNSGPLFAMLKGTAPYDAKVAQTHADNLKLLTEMKNGHFWPKGSDNTNPELKGKTRALPAIWADGSDVRAKGAAWGKAVAELAAVAGAGKEAMVEKMKLVGAACSACHKEYRAKDF